MDRPERVDIAVVGAGPVGHAVALLVSEFAKSVALIGPDVSPSETRTTALLNGSVRLFRHVGAWDAMEEHGAPLKTMRIIDDTGRLVRAPTVTFEAEEIGEDQFGINVPVRHVTAALARRVSEAPAITRMTGAVSALEETAESATLTLADGSALQADMVIAADGRLSVCRESLGITVSEQRYPQSAIALNLTHEKPHNDISTEFHKPTGPFTLVPLHGLNSALVCVVTPDEAEELVALRPDQLGREITRRSRGLLGQIKANGPARSYPLVSQTARRLVGERTALVGEAAHVMPPIGAQGLNLGLRDIASIYECLARHWVPGGDPAAALSAYSRARTVDIRTRMTAVDLLNRSLLSDFIGLQGLRSLGLHAVRGIAPLRRMVMREGLSPSYATPSLMRG
ncbi:MAG: UbiH/UbiF family hydroxylase [Pseudomonadota bacterium]